MVEIHGILKDVCSCKASSVTCPDKLSLFVAGFLLQRGEPGIAGAYNGVCIDYGSK